MSRQRLQATRSTGWRAAVHRANAPRDPALAATSAAVMLLACSVTLVTNAVTAYAARGQFSHFLLSALISLAQHNFVVPGILVGLAALLHGSRGRWPTVLGVPGALVAVAAVMLLNALGRDTSAGAQFYLLFPVLYAAFHLRSLAAYLVTAFAIGTEIWFTHTYLSWVAALHDSVVVTMVLVAATWMITTLRNRQEAGERTLSELASRDSLTGLATRRVFEETGAVIARGRSALILVDLDHFKAINDTHGHPAGDIVLEAMAEHLQAFTRPGDLVSRLGGDEFAILLADCSERTATERANDLLTRVTSQRVPLNDSACVDVSISVGVAVTSEGEELERLYARADSSLYAAKRDGRGRVGPLETPVETAPELPRPRAADSGAMLESQVAPA